MIVVLGSGGHARLVVEAWLASGGEPPAAYLDDDSRRWGTTIDGIPVTGSLDAPVEGARAGTRALLGIGAISRPTLRVSVLARIADRGYEFPPVVHPTAHVSPSATLSAGVTVLAGAIIGRGARLGDHVTVYSGSIVEHDCTVERHAQIAPGVCIGGGVNLAEECFVGLGARILQGLSVGRAAQIGAGAVVLQDVPPGVTVVGVPARTVGSAPGNPRSA